MKFHEKGQGRPTTIRIIRLSREIFNIFLFSSPQEIPNCIHRITNLLNNFCHHG